MDERIFELFDIEQISIGDYVLTGGELPSMVIIDSLARFVDGVISKDSLTSESFSNGLLEYPQYSRPEIWHERAVPPILLSGHHANIAKWRRKQAILRTRVRRPDLYDALDLTSKADQKLLQELAAEILAAGVTFLFLAGKKKRYGY